MIKNNSITYYLKNNERHFLILLFIVTFLLRSIYAFIAFNNNNTTSWADDWEYLSMGTQISSGVWDPRIINDGRHMQVAPLLPIIIAISLKIIGNSYIPIFILNCILTSLLVPLLYLVGKELFNRKIAILFSIWGLFFLDYYKYNPHLLKEPLVFFFLPLTLYYLIKSIKYDFKLFYILVLSISFVLLIHSDERYFMYFPLLTLLFFVNPNMPRGKIIKPIIQFTGIVFILMTPWLIRNYIIFNQVVIISPRTTVFTSEIIGSNINEMNFSYEDSQRDTITARKIKAIEFGKLHNIIPYKFDKRQMYLKAIINYWQPAYINPTFIQDGYRPQLWSFWHNLAGILFYGIFLPFYIIGLYFMLKKKIYLVFIISLIPILHSIIHIYMIWPLERYRSPTVFIIVCASFYAISQISEKIKNKMKCHF